MLEQPTTVFTALNAMQRRSSEEKAVRLSVRLSVCQTREL